MKCVTVSRALIVRICFAGHGLISIYFLTHFTKNINYWYLATALGGLFLETMVTLIRKYGNEWKWFCPSVFFYLFSVVPAIWCYEMELFIIRDRINRLCQTSLNANNFTLPANSTRHRNMNQMNKCSYLADLEIRDYPFLSRRNRQIDYQSMENYVRVSEQLLLLLLILGRWFLPKGKLSHDQLSQLLLVYLGTAADIAEFFEAFKEKSVRSNPKLCMTILGIWSWSLLQFSFVLTASRARKDQSGLLTNRHNSSNNFVGNNLHQASFEGMSFVSVVHAKSKTHHIIPDWFSGDFYGILLSICLQDLPFLAFRLALIFYYKVVSYTNMFFTAKNSLVIILLIYRLIVIWRQQKKKIQNDSKKGDKIDVPRIWSSLDNGMEGVSFNNKSLDKTSTLPRKIPQYQCKDPKNWISNYSSFIDLETGIVIKKNSMENGFYLSSSSNDENVMLGSSNIPLTSKSDQELSKFINNSQKSIENLNIPQVKFKNTPQHYHSQQINPESKIGLEIELMCKEAEVFLSKNKLNTSE